MLMSHVMSLNLIHNFIPTDMNDEERVNSPPLLRNRSATVKLARTVCRIFVSVPKFNQSRHMSVELLDHPTVDENIWKPNKYTKYLIIRTWENELEFLYQIGSEIYEKILSNCSEAQILFPGFEKDGWKESAEFRQQILRFVQVITEAVRNLENLSQFHKSILYNVGRAHCKYADRGFRPHHWLLFQSAIKKTMKIRVQDMNDLTRKQKKDVVKAWNYLAEQLILGMHKGFNDGMHAGKRKLSF